ncbi:transposable element Tcb2 transposase [Trichonephila clavipes]|nr:transposable element Tcb2 transposase [Trichonephila clavipes]
MSHKQRVLILAFYSFEHVLVPLTAQRYIDDILRPHVGPFLNGLPGTIFQRDNAHPPTARVAQDFLRHFQTLPWPARCPDSSSVEHVWDQLNQQIPSCHSVHDLELAVQVLWAHLPQENIRRLINSMPDHVAACIAAGGVVQHAIEVAQCCKLGGKVECFRICLSTMSHAFSMMLRSGSCGHGKKVLEVRLLLNEPIINAFRTMHSYIMVHEVPVAVIKECNIIYCSGPANIPRCLFLPSINIRTPLSCWQNMPHIMILPPDPCAVQAKQRWFHGFVGSRPILHLTLVKNKV